MTINKEKNNGILTLAIEGRLDTVTAPELEKVVNEETADVRELILDMKGLEYIRRTPRASGCSEKDEQAGRYEAYRRMRCCYGSL